MRANLAAGNATEHTHRPALKALLEGAAVGVTATNEPRRIECGAPDFVVSRTARESAGMPQPVGYVEAKDCDVDLSVIERDSDRRSPRTDNGKQLKRYRAALPNLLLTNYLEFRWYLDGKPRQVATLADLDDRSGLAVDRGGIEALRGLLQYFLIQGPVELSTAEDLARRMARIAHMIRDIVGRGFEQEQVSQDLQDLYAASKDVLVPDLDPDDFADMFAQTLAYGLFAARVNHESGPFHWQNAAHHIPAANPFMQQVFAMVAGPGLSSEPFASFVDDLAQLLDAAQMDLVLAHFGRREARQDPIMHFYETFLAAYDPELRERRGVYYTPEPVISYIVRSVDHLLRERFGCPEGLADHGKARYRDDGGAEREAHRVLVLDPACGTGSFLYAVIDHVREHHQTSGRAGMWRGYVKDHLLPRLFGFELLMAAYAMAHLKLGMQLAALDLPETAREDWAYPFDAGERLGVYLTNTLDPGESQTASMFGPLRTLTQEANAAIGVKRDLPIMVVLGNPPYSGHSANASRRDGKLTWIGNLIEDYRQVDGKPLGERTSKWLQDDYVKFIRFGQWRIEQSGAGILAFITNHAYLNNPTFRGMRQQLMHAFTDIYLLDLHGNAKLRERAPDGGVDQNVFDIQQGVAIAILIKEAGRTTPARIHHQDIWGDRESKYETLAMEDVSTIEWSVLSPTTPQYLFVPRDEENIEDYLSGWGVKEIFPINGVGITTAHDDFVIDIDKSVLVSRFDDFKHTERSAEILHDSFHVERKKGWNILDGWDNLQGRDDLDGFVEPIIYRPFDRKFVFYEDKLVWRTARRVMRHMLDGRNVGLCIGRAGQVIGSDMWDIAFISRSISEFNLFRRGGNCLFPLYIRPSDREIKQGLYQRSERRPNLDPAFTADLERRLDLEFVHGGRGDLESTFGPEDVLHYIYAVLHSPSYRERYAQFLRADFPRIPLPNGLEQFHGLAVLGREITAVHLLESPTLDASDIRFPIPGDDIVEPQHPKYFAPGETRWPETTPFERGRVYINGGARAQYFEGIAPEVWEFRIGGYQPLDKWLKDRKGRKLTIDDQFHYIRIAAALRETIRLMVAIDEVGLPFP
ncbi:MAG: N-6 DNA methylase [Chloroflexi bacterium]|nr:N-6 DNA methylase [Chloroflexota bacterium]